MEKKRTKITNVLGLEYIHNTHGQTHTHLSDTFMLLSLTRARMRTHNYTDRSPRQQQCVPTSRRATAACCRKSHRLNRKRTRSRTLRLHISQT